MLDQWHMFSSGSFLFCATQIFLPHSRDRYSQERDLYANQSVLSPRSAMLSLKDRRLSRLIRHFMRIWNARERADGSFRARYKGWVILKEVICTLNVMSPELALMTISCYSHCSCDTFLLVAEKHVPCNVSWAYFKPRIRKMSCGRRGKSGANWLGA